jgi:hypothetical protein
VEGGGREQAAGGDWQWQWQGGSGRMCQLIGGGVAVVGLQWCEWIGSVIVSILIGDSATIRVL